MSTDGGHWWLRSLLTCSRASVDSDALQDAITASGPQILSMLLITGHSLRRAACLLYRCLAVCETQGLQGTRNSCSNFGCRLD